MDVVHSSQIENPEQYQVSEIAKKLNTNTKTGLTSFSAANNQKNFGYNEITKKKKKSFIILFLSQLINPMIILLLVATFVSVIPLIINTVHGIENQLAEICEPFIILFIVIMNSLIGAVQEHKADIAIESIKKMITSKVKVIRDNRMMLIDSYQLTVGDIIYLEAGDNIYADARIIETNNLKVMESILTGESESVDKNADHVFKTSTPIGDRDNMVYSGCTVVNGTGKGIVTNIGMQTELGKIAKIIEDVKPQKTFFQKQLDRFGKIISIICVVICFSVLIANLILIGINNEFSNSSKIISAIMVAISLAVAAIPEGLPIVITITMAIGIKNIAKQNAIVKQSSVIEELGCASVICSDKTGTLTENKMTLVNLYNLAKDKLIHESDLSNKDDCLDILKYAAMCTNAAYDPIKKISTGDPTETCLLIGLDKYFNINKSVLDNEYQRLYEFPFDSERKLMSCVVQHNNKRFVVVKGATSELMKISNLSEQDIKKIEIANFQISSSGKRVLALAYKEIPDDIDYKTIKNVENNLNFLGLLGIVDPIRESAKLSVQQCINNGIKVVMITGDQILTAKSIASQLGIYTNDDLAITGAELDKMSDEEFSKKINKISIYARVSPANKLRIVKAFQTLNQIVVMTGDGVSDAPALKQANIGCAMGITGTDVSKNAADVVLLDDNFSTIVNAIKTGRSIFKNILKVINFLIAGNVAEFITIVILFIVGLLTGIKSTFTPIQILWINLITDSLPAIALGLEKIDNNVMFDKPRGAKTSLFANKLLLKIMLESLMQVVVCLSVYFMVYYNYASVNGTFASQAALTFTFVSISFIQILFTFNIKNNKSIFKSNIFNNKYLNYANIIALILILFVLLTPKVNAVFDLIDIYHPDCQLGLMYLYIMLIVFLTPLCWVEIEKIFFNKYVYRINNK